MVFKCTNLLRAVVAFALAALLEPPSTNGQFAPNPWQQVLSRVRAVDLSSGAAGSIVSLWEQTADGLRKTLVDLGSTLSGSGELAESKVRDFYVPALARLWRWQVGYAQWINPETLAATCPEDPALGRLLRDVETEALDCVHNIVPPGIPEVGRNINKTLGHIMEFIIRARALAEECDNQTNFQGTMCKATRLAPMGGTMGLLGGEVGRVAGQLAVLVDGSARQCLHAARQERESEAQAAAFAMAECIKTAGGNHGSLELEKYYQAQVLNNAILATH